MDPDPEHWYKDVTVLLFCLGSWLVSALSAPNAVEGYNFSFDLHPTLIQSYQYSSTASKLQAPTESQANPKPNSDVNMLLINLHSL